ncbi:MAG: hypothetical protein WDO15_05985 [Bacteroidota bacterium]
MRLLIILMVATFALFCSSIAGAQSYDQKIPDTNISFKMISIPAGKFTIGSKDPIDSDEGSGQRDRTVGILDGGARF